MFTNINAHCIPDGRTNVAKARQFSAKIHTAFFNNGFYLTTRQAHNMLALFFQSEYRYSFVKFFLLKNRKKKILLNVTL